MTNELIQFSERQIQLIKSQCAPEASEDELKLFLYQASRTGLDPLTRQIYCISRSVKNFNGTYSKKMTIQTSIDGFRVIAERSGDYAGQDEPIFTEKDGKLISCKITVYRFRGDLRYPAAIGLAYWDEYAQTGKDGKPNSMWGKMPHTMLAKVAEALALRKAYPQDLSGLYTGDEMSQADERDFNQLPEGQFFKKPQGELANIADQGNQELEEKRIEKKAIDADAKQKAAEVFFAKVKAEFESEFGSLPEIEALEEKYAKQIKSLEKYPVLHGMLLDTIAAAKVGFEN